MTLTFATESILVFVACFASALVPSLKISAVG